MKMASSKLGCSIFLLICVFASTMAIELDENPMHKRHFFALSGMRSELCRFFKSPVQYVYSPSQNSSSLISRSEHVNATQTDIKPHFAFSPSFLTLWSSDITKAMVDAANLKTNSTNSPQTKRATLSEMFKYNTSWIIGLAVIATVIAIFFIGCVIVICYTRRPYRRSGKVYEIETGSKKSKSNKIPQLPTVHPSTKTATLTRSKELYY